MNRSTLYTVIGCVFALALGAVAGSMRVFVHTDAPTEPQNGRPLVAGEPRPSSSAGGAPKDGTAMPRRDFDEAIGEAIRAETGAKRWLLLLSAAEKASAQDMPALIRMVGEDSVAIRMLGARWAELDPKHMFISLCADYLLPEGAAGALPGRYMLSDVLFEQWTRSDLPGAIKALNDAPNFAARDSLRMSVANQVMKLDVEQAFRVMKE
jgi:hypothetical protein